MRDELAKAVKRGAAVIGDYSYGAPSLWYIGLGLRFICGKYCSFGPDVTVMLASNHRHDWATTYPFPGFLGEWPAAAGMTGHVAGKGDVVVGNDVWVGFGAMLGSGVHVGDGAVIAARSVVVKDVPPYAIVGGNPARVIRYRFDEPTIGALLRLRWWDWPRERVEANLPLLLSPDISTFIDANTPREPPAEPGADPRLAAARRALFRASEDVLANTPLVAMAAWVAKGEAPPAATLRAEGFTAQPAEPGEAAARRAARLAQARQAFVARWGFAIPCAEAIAALRELAPIVEIGAGGWAAMLRNAGHEVAAASGAASAAHAVSALPDHDVLCVWPPSGESAALGAAWRLAPGRCFALIGDGPGGRNGSRGLYRYLGTRFETVAEVALPQFPNQRDRLTIHRKLPRGARP
jgi:acetyltransferase-like isoleucine patch superfamily enzyme